jgi:PAS domain S-box-containing protein
MDESLSPSIDLARLARLETVLETVTDAVYAVDPDWTITLFNRAAETYFGARREEVIGGSLWKIFPGGRETHYGQALERAMADREPAVIVAPAVLKPGRFIELRIAPMDGEAGMVVSLSDVTERKQAEEALRAERDRNAAILESISDAFYAVDRQWRLTYLNRVAEAWWGQPREELLGANIWDIFPRAVGTDTYAAHLEAAETGQIVRLEADVRRIHRWLDLSIFPSKGGLSVYMRDITDRKNAERRQQLLVNELNHRVKNTLAVIQAIARQTLREGRNMGEAREAFVERLLALADAHDVITREQWSGAELQDLIQRAICSHLDRPERLHLDGVSVHIAPKTALSLALALHELLTNALKYGSLSVPDGEVDLTWRVAAEGPMRRRLHLTWRERGGPPVTPPKRKGFGSRLIERGLPVELGGEVHLKFEAAGLVCDIDADLPPADVLQLP